MMRIFMCWKLTPPCERGMSQLPRLQPGCNTPVPRRMLLQYEKNELKRAGGTWYASEPYGHKMVDTFWLSNSEEPGGTQKKFEKFTDPMDSCCAVLRVIWCFLSEDILFLKGCPGLRVSDGELSQLFWSGWCIRSQDELWTFPFPFSTLSMLPVKSWDVAFYKDICVNSFGLFWIPQSWSISKPNSLA